MKLHCLVSITLTILLVSTTSARISEPRALMELKASLDPNGSLLSSWKSNMDPCKVEWFEGVACNGEGKVVNVSLQGKGLRGSISPAVGELHHLEGLFLHYNDISGEIPREIGHLTTLSQIYLNVNNLSGTIPVEIGGLISLQVLQLSHNRLTGNIPMEVGLMKKLGFLGLQSNLITGLIPDNLGDLPQMTRLDLSFNRLGGIIPTKLARLPHLMMLDVRNNSLFGAVPSELGSLKGGFLYGNNSDLCGTGFPSLRSCSSGNMPNASKPEAYRANVSDQKQREKEEYIPRSADVTSNCTHCPNPSSMSHSIRIVVVVIVVLCATILLIITTWYWRQQRCDKSLETTDVMLNNEMVRNAHRKSWSPLISLEYPKGWDPLAYDGKSGFCQRLRFNVEEMEFATQHFSEVNLLGRNHFSATYRGILRDGSVVAVRCISKISCKSEESRFLKGLKVLTSLRHDNLVGLRGFCCSKARGECFLVYDFVANGSLSQYIMGVRSSSRSNHGGIFLDWAKRASIIKGIARGIEYLHSSKPTKPPLVHQYISANNILIDHHFKPLISSSGLHKLLTDDVVFSALKSSAAMGYLAPEYASTGQFTEKSDIYAFGVLILQILGGRKEAAHLRNGIQQCTLGEIVDKNLHGNFPEMEAAKFVSIAFACTSESPDQRPRMDDIIQELCGKLQA